MRDIPCLFVIVYILHCACACNMWQGRDTRTHTLFLFTPYSILITGGGHKMDTATCGGQCGQVLVNLVNPSQGSSTLWSLPLWSAFKSLLLGAFIWHTYMIKPLQSFPSQLYFNCKTSIVWLYIFVAVLCFWGYSWHHCG